MLLMMITVKMDGCSSLCHKHMLLFLFQDKDEINSLNKYSHNFFGVYCTCSRPYPDPEDQVGHTPDPHLTATFTLLSLLKHFLSLVVFVPGGG